MSDPFGPQGPVPPPSQPIPQGSPAGRPEFLQPKYVIGLGVAAVLMLVAGIVIATRGGSDTVTTTRISTTSSTVTPTTRVLTTTPPPLPATTTSSTSTSTTTSTTSTSTSTLPPAPAVANAGDDLAVDAGATVTVTARDLSDTNQSVVWRQVAGPDVTDGRGRLIGAEAAFEAPPRPTTLRFTVTVTGRGGDVATDELRIDVYEQADRALFVDGIDGSPSGDGSRALPYRDLARAISEAESRRDGTDIYIRATDSAYTATREIEGGSSFYGGYDADWVKTDEGRAVIGGVLLFTGPAPFVLSSIELRGFDNPGGTVLGVTGSASVRIEGSVVRAGAATAGTNIAVRIEDVSSVEIIDSEISAGDGGSGADAPTTDRPDPPLVPGPPGNDAVGESGAAAVDGRPATQGGDGGLGLADGAPGGAGALGGSPGEHGAPGLGGAGGLPGNGGTGGGGVDDDGLTGVSGDPGLPGGAGAPGGGAGGGGGVLAHDGGGGGGGGAGGQGGPAGLGGEGGRASVALLIQNVAQFRLHGSIVVGGVGGDGGDGGRPLEGTSGGAGGLGAPGVTSFLDTAGSGGNGGGGGSGGQGGWGGGGAGGPSIGLLTANVGTALISSSEIRGGSGGAGGVGGQPSAGGRSGADGGPVGVIEGAVGGVGSGDRRSEIAAQSSGGDSIGWSDDGGTRREIVDSTVVAGEPGDPGGVGGRAGQAIDTTF